MGYKYIFGPVVSRRLGLSLGIDPIKRKHCTLDCIYCQVARTDMHSIKREVDIKAELIIDEIKDFIENGGKADFITFVGSGEPLLNSEIGKMIDGIAEITDIPIAVITNGTLLSVKKVRDEIMNAALVMPNVDAGDSKTFNKINRPADGLNFNEMIEGIRKFSHEYKGRLFIEVFIIPGINSSDKQIKKIADIIKSLHNVEGIEINTTARPSHSEEAIEADEKLIKKVAEILSDCGKVKIIENYKKVDSGKKLKNEVNEDDICGITSRHPATTAELSLFLSVKKEVVEKKVDELVASGKLVKGVNGHYRVIEN